jgi:signal transduction histidine kinase
VNPVGSLRARLAALAAVLIVAGGLVGGVATWVLDAYGEAIGNQARASVIIAAVTITVGLVFCGTWLVHRALAPLSGLVRASREVTQGRHPDEAFGDLQLEGELQHLAEDVRVLSLRLREIDATDRRFLMSISHELRTPLTAITGHAQAIEDFADDEEMRTQSLGVIRREAERLERLIEDIVDLARLRSNKFTTVTEPVNLDELGEHLLAIFDSGSIVPETGHVVGVIGEFEDLDFHSDGQRILQILRNLVGNALRYATSEVRIDGHRVAGHVRLSVINDGTPISPSQQDRIFEPFIGTKREGGLGLGLAIGRELSWALGGNLRCVDRPDGAEFELTLPLEPPGTGR